MERYYLSFKNEYDFYMLKKKLSPATSDLVVRVQAFYGFVHDKGIKENEYIYLRAIVDIVICLLERCAYCSNRCEYFNADKKIKPMLTELQFLLDNK